VTECPAAVVAAMAATRPATGAAAATVAVVARNYSKDNDGVGAVTPSIGPRLRLSDCDLDGVDGVGSGHHGG